MKLHVLSDLHLGVNMMEVPDTGADIVILAGDIARPEAAIAWASQFAGPVLYVPGNHEFYGSSLDGTVATLRRCCQGTAVRLLDTEAVVIDGVRFLGATLWTDFALFDDPEQRQNAEQAAVGFMRDFSRIRVSDASPALFSPAVSARLFGRYAAWLEAKLAEPHAGPTVVITHHAPSPRSIHPRFAGSLLNVAFVSDLERLMDGRRAALWIHGHTHDSFDYTVNGTRVICNPRGYAKEGVNENSQFDPTLVVTV